MKIKAQAKKDFILNCVFWTLLLAVLFVLFKYVLNWFLPFVVGFVLAVMSNYLASRLTKRMGRGHKFLSVVINVLLLLIIGGAIAGVFYGVYTQIARFINERIINGDLIAQLMDSLRAITSRIPENFQKEIISAARNAVSSVVSLATGLVGSVVTGAPGVLLGVVIAVIASFIFSGDYPKITQFLMLQLPENIRGMVPKYKDSLKNTFGKLIGAYLVIILLTFTELSIGLSLLKEPYTFAIAAITALIDILPVFGTGFILWPWAAFKLINGDYVFAAALLIIYAIIQIVRQVVEPHLVGHSIGVHPILTLMAMYVGVKIMGPAGIFLFPILLILIKNLQDNGYVEVWTPLPRTEPERRRRLFVRRKKSPGTESGGQDTSSGAGK